MKFVQLSLTGSYVETAPLSRSLMQAGRGPVFRFDVFLVRIERLLAAKKVDTVLIDHRLDFHAPSPGVLESIRHQLERLVQAGKRVVYYARSYDTVTLYLASACSERIVHPLGSLRFQGMARSFLFFKRLLEKYDVQAEIVRRGRYKSAGDPFRVERLDEHNREQHEALLAATMNDFIEKVAAGFGKERKAVDALIDGTILGAEAAVSAGWINRAVGRRTLVDEWRKDKAKEVKLGKVKPLFGRGRKVAVLVFDGAIVDGRTRQDPLLGQSIGSESFLPEIEKLKRRRSVKGVVLRVNSGGGSAIASEEIAEGLARLAEKKPLVVSMSGVAGSGGYWISTPAERVFAERTTITGSIGVIMMLFSLRTTLDRLGVTESTVKIGELADLGSPFGPITDRGRALLEEEVDRLYRDFLAKVAKARKSTPEEIHKSAEGRIWSGEEAQRIGLVDETGGLDAALSYLKGKLKAKRLKVLFYPVVRYPFIQRLIMRSAATMDAGRLPVSERLDSPLAPALPAAEVALSALLRLQGRPLAIVPYVMRQMP